MKTTTTKPRDRSDLQSSVILGMAKDMTFLLLNAIVQGYEFFEAAKYDRSAFVHGGLEAVHAVKRAEERRRWQRRLASMKQRGLIKTRREGGRLMHELTEKGGDMHLRKMIRYAPPREDGKVTLVVFDIPEQTKRSRDVLRRFLKDVGFRMLQRSVWTTRKDCSRALGTWIRGNGWQKWLCVFVAESAENV